MAKKAKKKSKTKRKFSAKQIAAQKKFAARAKAGTLRKGSKLKASSPSKGGKGGSKGGRKMAKKKRKKSKQGIVSWLVNVTSLAIVASNPVMRIIEAMGKAEGNKWGHFYRAMASDYGGIGIDLEGNYVDFDVKRMARGWGTVAVGVGFKKVMSKATQSIKIQSLIPGR